MYGGRARWSEIRAVVDAVSIPVIGNGDIVTAIDAVRMREETGCAAIMIARGSHGNPWIFAQARAALDGLSPPPEPDEADEAWAECCELILAARRDYPQLNKEPARKRAFLTAVSQLARIRGTFLARLWAWWTRLG